MNRFKQSKNIDLTLLIKWLVAASLIFLIPGYYVSKSLNSISELIFIVVVSVIVFSLWYSLYLAAYPEKSILPFPYLWLFIGLYVSPIFLGSAIAIISKQFLPMGLDDLIGFMATIAFFAIIFWINKMLERGAKLKKYVSNPEGTIHNYPPIW